MKTYFTIVWTESGDELHFMLLPIEELELVNDFANKSVSKEVGWDELGELMDTIRKKSIESVWTQTYCNDEFPFQSYNVTRMIYLQEFGC